MHSIIKNLSKVLALTTMVSSFAILPGAKASGTEPENIPQLQNGRSGTQVITDEMINQAIADLNERLGGTDVVRCSPAFLSNRPVAYKILQALISYSTTIVPYHGRTAAAIQEKFTQPGRKLLLKSLSEASDALLKSCSLPRDADASITVGDIPTLGVQGPDITPNAITMFFNWTHERDHYTRRLSRFNTNYNSVLTIASNALDCFLHILAIAEPPIHLGYSDQCALSLMPVIT